ncbi:hypothetical protein V7968_02585 [Nocardia vulneris]|uniref:hypothetical protein n=1 Tax=Nocardia vulneris TaxID=1141657 RepID=UPI0030CE6957
MARGGLGDPEDRDDGVGASDLDFGYEYVYERFAGLVAACGDYCGDVIGHIVQNGGGGDDRALVDGGEEFVSACGELSAGVA